MPARCTGPLTLEPGNCSSKSLHRPDGLRSLISIHLGQSPCSSQTPGDACPPGARHRWDYSRSTPGHTATADLGLQCREGGRGASRRKRGRHGLVKVASWVWCDPDRTEARLPSQRPRVQAGLESGPPAPPPMGQVLLQGVASRAGTHGTSHSCFFEGLEALQAPRACFRLEEGEARAER